MTLDPGVRASSGPLSRPFPARAIFLCHLRALPGRVAGSTENPGGPYLTLPTLPCRSHGK